MSLEDEVQRIMDMGVKATPAGIRALTEGPQYVDDPDRRHRHADARCQP